MMKIIHPHAMRPVLAALLAMAMLIGMVPVRGVQAAEVQSDTLKASYIEKMENAPQVDLEKYADSSVLFKLSDNVREDEEISVIITVDAPNLMDAYNAGDKAMSFAEYALSSFEAAELEALWIKMGNCLGDNKSLQPIGVYLPSENKTATFHGFLVFPILLIMIK